METRIFSNQNLEKVFGWRFMHPWRYYSGESRFAIPPAQDNARAEEHVEGYVLYIYNDMIKNHKLS